MRTIQITLEHRLDAFKTGAALDLGPYFSQAHRLILDANRELYASQGASVGAPWDALKRGTLKARARRGTGTQILKFATPQGGRIEGSFTDSTNPWHLYEVEETSLSVGSSLGITKVLDEGAVLTRTLKTGGVRVIQVKGRRLTGLNDRHERALSDLLRTTIRTSLGGDP